MRILHIIEPVLMRFHKKFHKHLKMIKNYNETYSFLSWLLYTEIYALVHKKELLRAHVF